MMYERRDRLHLHRWDSVWRSQGNAVWHTRKDGEAHTSGLGAKRRAECLRDYIAWEISIYSGFNRSPYVDHGFFALSQSSSRDFCRVESGFPNIASCEGWRHGLILLLLRCRSLAGLIKGPSFVVCLHVSHGARSCFKSPANFMPVAASPTLQACSTWASKHGSSRFPLSALH